MYMSILEFLKISIDTRISVYVPIHSRFKTATTTTVDSICCNFNVC